MFICNFSNTLTSREIKNGLDTFCEEWTATTWNSQLKTGTSVVFTL